MKPSRPYKINDFVRAYKINGLNLSTYMGTGQVVAETMTDLEILVKSWGGDNQFGNHLLKKHKYYFELDDVDELPPEAPANRYSIELDEVRHQIRIMETTPNGRQEAVCYEQGDWRQSPNMVFQLVRDIISVLTKDEISNFACWKENDTDLGSVLPRSLADGSLEVPDRTHLKPCDNFEQLLTQVGRLMDANLDGRRAADSDGRQLLHDQVVWGCYVTDFLKIMHKVMGTPDYGVVQRMGKLALAQPEENIILTPVTESDNLVGYGKRPE